VTGVAVSLLRDTQGQNPDSGNSRLHYITGTAEEIRRRQHTTELWSPPAVTRVVVKATFANSTNDLTSSLAIVFFRVSNAASSFL